LRRRPSHIQGADRMNERGKKLEPKLGLDMPFGEALERFVRVKPHEVDRSVEKSKQTKPSAGKKPKARKK
jgi:hypothetical protein